MRTDSCSLSQEAIRNIKTEVIKQYGESYHQARQFKTKIKGAQEAHEAIRPTSMKNHVVGANTDERKLYELIWKRTLASQMADASFEKTRIEITSPLASYHFVANGEVMLFDGFMRVYSQSSEDENAMQALPPLQAGAELIFNEMVAQESFTKAPYRYREADLVEKMEDLHIGRPSTYAPIIETIQTRKYVELTNIEGTKRDYHVLTLKNGKISHKTKVEKVGQESQKLLPTDLGRVTNDFLVEQFPNILSYDFTAKEEENFDLIAAGEANWVEVIDNFYKHFHPAIQQVPSGKVAGRLIGYEPKTGAPVYAKISKIGPCIQIGDAEVDKPKFASLKPGQSLFTITLEEALELFVVHKPAPVCVIDGEEVFVGKGKYGPYIRYKGGFVSIPKSMDPEHLTQEDVVGLIAHHEKQQDAIHTFGDMQVMSGRYGAYIKTPTGNYRIAKSVNVESLTQEACEQIIANSASVAPRTKKNTRKK
jgi:DNA topoisomerase-1